MGLRATPGRVGRGGTVATPTRAKGGGTVATPVPGPSGPSTVATPVGSAGKGPELTLTDVLARLWINAPFDERSWPFVQFGDDAPARFLQSDEDWIEDLSGNALTKGRFQEDAKRKFQEETAGASREFSEDVQLKGIVPLAIGSAIREISFSFSDGGSNPLSSASSSSLGKRGVPLERLLRSITNTFNNVTARLVRSTRKTIATRRG